MDRSARALAESGGEGSLGLARAEARSRAPPVFDWDLRGRGDLLMENGKGSGELGRGWPDGYAAWDPCPM